LKRNTIWPRPDFAIAPLTKTSREHVIRAIGGNVPKKVIHIQIERAGILEFGAYDNFQPVVFGPGLSPEFLSSLTARRIQ
jgi:hypothetical protein